MAATSSRRVVTSKSVDGGRPSRSHPETGREKGFPFARRDDRWWLLRVWLSQACHIWTSDSTSGATSAGWFGLLCRASPVGQRADNRCHLKLCAPTTTRRDCARPAPAPHTTACRDCSRRVPAGRARRSGRRSARRPRRANRWAATAAVKQVATDVLGSVPVLGKLAQQALDHVKIPHLWRLKTGAGHNPAKTLPRSRKGGGFLVNAVVSLWRMWLGYQQPPKVWCTRTRATRGKTMAGMAGICREVLADCCRAGNHHRHDHACSREVSTGGSARSPSHQSCAAPRRAGKWTPSSQRLSAICWCTRPPRPQTPF